MKTALMLELQVTHSYKDGPCSDVLFVPTAETEALLRKHRCLGRYESGKAKILTSVEPTGNATLPLPANTTLRFALECQSLEFVLVTDLSEFEKLSLPLLTNRAMGAACTGTLEQPEADTTPGKKKRANMVADVEIVLPTGSAQPATFKVAFKAKKARWAYYCITNLKLESEALASKNLKITDTSPGNDAIVFGEANRKIFDAETTASEFEDDPLAKLLVKQNPGACCWRFLSDLPIALRAEPRRGLELRLGNNCLSRHLPNPAARNTAGITLDGLPKAIEAQVHIIRYISKT